MSALLITLIVLGLIEAGSALGCWTVGKVPERTMAGVLINAVFCLALAGWAAWLLVNGAQP